MSIFNIKKELNDCQNAITGIRNDLNRMLNELHDMNISTRNLKTKIDNKDREIKQLEDVIQSQHELIRFLTDKNFSKEDIEFAAIKTYRGWVCMYLNGIEVDANKATDLTIYCDPNEPVRISSERV